MTDGEAQKLRPGDVVTAYRNGRRGSFEIATVFRHMSGKVAGLYARKHGLTKAGHRHAQRFVYPDDVIAMVEVATANVYADWLDEHDEPVAAAKLRRAFPLNGEG